MNAQTVVMNAPRGCARHTLVLEGADIADVMVDSDIGSSTERLLRSGRMQARRPALDSLVTQRAPACAADSACTTAFEDPDCLKTVLDWRDAP